ncbi:hypothetical protein CLF_111230 [Clonorchis sinensis]|uniref:Uncharacterized protein n=1 Tax=Clonorchis sinensis TaxID=79923 RepID=G7YLI8_CLOSI|nr:hypothetical protein CLF_111230 [Clonorchis sinensis]
MAATAWRDLSVKLKDDIVDKLAPKCLLRPRLTFRLVPARTPLINQYGYSVYTCFRYSEVTFPPCINLSSQSYIAQVNFPFVGNDLPNTEEATAITSGRFAQAARTVCQQTEVDGATLDYKLHEAFDCASAADFTSIFVYYIGSLVSAKPINNTAAIAMITSYAHPPDMASRTKDETLFTDVWNTQMIEAFDQAFRVGFNLVVQRQRKIVSDIKICNLDLKIFPAFP